MRVYIILSVSTLYVNILFQEMVYISIDRKYYVFIYLFKMNAFYLFSMVTVSVQNLDQKLDKS